MSWSLGCHLILRSIYLEGWITVRSLRSYIGFKSKVQVAFNRSNVLGTPAPFCSNFIGASLLQISMALKIAE